MWIKKTILYLLFYGLIFFGVFFINTQVIQISFVPSESMDPAIKKNTFIVCSRNVKEIDRYDIITFKYQGRLLVKRVIGLPGETIEIKDNETYINEKQLDEPYLKEDMQSEDYICKIPDGCYFVMGDNRNQSNDSRSFGSITKSDITGRKKQQIK